MKKINIFIITFLFISTIFLTIPSYASTNASDQISAYGMEVIPVSGNKIAIQFTITASYKMATIGAKSIIIYEKSGSSWLYSGGFTQDDEGMTRTNAFNYGNTIYYDAESETEYRVHVTLFAEDSSGASDSRSKTFYITTE